MSEQKLAKLSAPLAFPHVVDAYRALAETAEIWRRVGVLDSTLNAQELKDREIAGIRFPTLKVTARDYILVRGRSLVEFFEKESKRSDIRVADFDLELDPTIQKKFKDYRRAIEVHLLHLTAWRNKGYRENNAGEDSDVQRPDWEQITTGFARDLVDALQHLAVTQTKDDPARALSQQEQTAAKAWLEIFGTLHKTVTDRMRAFEWAYEPVREKLTTYGFLPAETDTES